MVYRPREDSYLLIKELKEREFEGKKCLDMGTGSGIQAIKMAEKGANVVAVDIDIEAIEYATKRAEEKNVRQSIEFKNSNLFETVQEKSFDLIVFNPPYLPGDDSIRNAETWKGGKKGTELTENFLLKAEKYLNKEGEVLLILSSNSEIETLIKKFNLEVLKQEKTWFETLYLAVFR